VKTVLLFISVISLGFTSQADIVRLEGEPFKPSTNTEIIWAATNDLPKGLWIYKNMPEAFSWAVISNAMKIGRFTMKDCSKATNPMYNDKRLIYFSNTNEYGLSKYLYIAPSVGVIEYHSEHAFKAPIENVPTTEETEQLGRGVLFQLGIDKALLSEHVRNGYDETSSSLNVKTKQMSPAKTVVRGVSFARKIDGIDISANWSFLIHFRSNSTVEDYILVWRNLLPYESRSVLATNQILESIKSGLSVLPEQAADFTLLNKAKKITITKVEATYSYGDVGQVDFVYPYADIEMAVDFGDSNIETYYLKCPIILANVIK